MNDTLWGLKYEEIGTAAEALLEQLSALADLAVARENLSAARGNISLHTNPSNPVFTGQVTASSIPLSTAAAKVALKVEVTTVVGIAMDRAIELDNQLDYLIESLKKASNE